MRAGGCPVAHERAPHPTQGGGNRGWWPDRLNLKILAKNPAVANPLGEDFDYAAAFESLDLAAVKQDIEDVLTTSQDWWPADYGHYGPFMIRMAWHSAGTYRISDGRGGAGAGQQRFAPLNSWPDNANLDKARRLLWPVKQKYGQSLSWADLMVLTGNVALESMGFETFGFAGGREDVWEPDEDVYWGPETEWLGDERYSGDRELEDPFGAVQMGLIYVNPEGPNANPDPLASARDIRETFHRMAMNDEETVALIAGGHTFGKTHGAADPDEYVGHEPEAAPLEQQGLGWKNAFGTGKGVGHDHQRPGGRLDAHPEDVGQQLLRDPVRARVGAHEEPRGRPSVDAEAAAARRPRVPDAHDPSATHPPMMLTTDLALRLDPVYEPISRRFYENPDEFADAFARAWFKLTHRDMGPIERYLGPEVPQEELLWQDPLPAVTHELIGAEEIAALKGQILASGLSVSAARPRRVGVGVDVPRQRQARRRQRRAHPPRAAERLGGQRPGRAGDGAGHARGHPGVLQRLPERQRQAGLARRPDRARRLRGRRAGGQGRRRRGRGPVHAGTRGRIAGADRRRTPSSALEPTADGFRNYLAEDHRLTAEYLLVDKANLLTLSAPEMTVLVGGLRVLGANSGGSQAGVLTDTPGTLTNDFFVEPARPGHDVDGDGRRRGDVREPRRRGRGQVDRHPRRPRVRLELRAARARGGLRERRRAREVRARLRRGVGQGHEPRPLRPQLISMSRPAPVGRPGHPRGVA